MKFFANTTLALTVALVPACMTDVLYDEDSADELAYEIGMAYGGEVPNQGLLELVIPSSEHVKALKRQSQDEDFDTNGPARGVEYFETYAVGSSNIGWEYVDAFQLSTTYDHGGPLMRVAVLQYGYGNGSASLSGAPGNKYLIEYLCGTLSNLHYCNVGETITGFMEYYSFDGAQAGYFSAFTNSTAFPFGQKTDAISIQ